VQQTFMQLQPTGFNLDGFFSLFKAPLAYIFSIHFLTFMYILGTIVIIALITFILYMFVRMYEIHQDDKKKYSATVVPTGLPSAIGDIPGLPVEKRNETWLAIRERLLSSNTRDWKLAIIEADIYMDRVLDDKGFHGDTTSDKLKQVTPDKLPSIQIAWEVHKVRNRIAHDGNAFVLTMPESRRLLSYFEIIFTDLGVI
jgi:hypothetical protein